MELTDAVQRQVGLSRRESASFVSKIIDEMVEALASGENILITGFGSFQVVDRAARTGRNPRTKEETQVEARKAVKFKCSRSLRDEMSKGERDGRKGLPGVFID